MAEVDSHVAGTFCWPELGTTDQHGAAEFYSGLFGWSVVEQPMGPGETYSMFKLRGLEAAAGYKLLPDQRKAGVPPHWGSYVSVANADDTAAKAASLGGRVLAGPFDVLDVGRMAVLQGPDQAIVSVWQPKRHIGARVLNEPGALGWTELNTRDLDLSARFYTGLFGWGTKTSAALPDYVEFTMDGKSIGGMWPIPAQMATVPPNWLPYFVVADCDASASRVRELGGQVHKAPADIPRVGRFAIVGDPQGAVFAIIALKM